MEATRWLAALSILIVMFVGICYFSKHGKTIATLGIPLTLVVAAGVIYWVKTTGDKAEDSSKRAVDAGSGAVSEEGVGDLFGELPKGCLVLHDFATKRGNIDHIVISPKGIITIARMSHKGVINCVWDALTRDGKPFEKDFIKQAWAQAFSIRDLLACNGISVSIPQPVLLFTNADVKVRKQVRGVEIIGKRYLPDYLERLHAHMTATETEKIFDLLISEAQMFV